MRTYLRTIKFLQTLFLVLGICVMLTLPLVLAFYPEAISAAGVLNLYDVSHLAIFFVMLIRPLADIFIRVKWVRPLVILRKGIGVFSASIVLSFIFSKIIMDPGGYISSLGTLRYWSLQNYALLAHLADLSAVLLVITSNNLSKRILGAFWKRIQKLSYVFFFASSLYVFLSFGSMHILLSVVVITAVTILAYVSNKKRIRSTPPPIGNPQTI